MKETEIKQYDKTIVVKLETRMWASLRKIAYEKNVSMAKLTRDGLEKIINKYEKAS